MNTLAQLIAVKHHDDYAGHCQQLAQQLQLPVVDSAIDSEQGTPYLLVYDALGLAVQQTGPKAAGPVRIDFSAGTSEHRRKQGGGELIVKAAGGNKQDKPTVLDVTAGLGRDSFVLASRGYPVTMCERSPLIAALLEDGLQRARDFGDAELQQVISHMRLLNINAVDYITSLEPEAVDVVVIDPMFPPSKKSALVKKDMQAFHQLVGPDDDSDALLAAALSVAKHRVIVKRPKKAQCLASKQPNFMVEGKAIRFDIYSLKAFKK